jgi:O-acetyl-ADP-ribose deacetylase (regulator of RNase III)
MGLSYVTKHLLDVSVSTLVIPVNCRGVAGRGLALAAKERYPNWFHIYRACCQYGELRVGRPLLHWGMEPMMVSFPTKDDWRFPSRLEWIEMGLVALRGLIVKHGLSEIAVPKLGCGAGGLCWERVQPLIEEQLSSLSCEVLVCISG